MSEETITPGTSSRNGVATPSIEQVEASTLQGLANAAKQGLRGFLIAGKVADVRRYTTKTGSQRCTVAVICSEGETMELGFESDAATPGKGQCGSFLVTPRRYMGNIAGFNCLAFA